MSVQLDDRSFELLIDYEQIKKQIRLIGVQLNVAYEGRVPIFIGILNGCFMFMADLMKEIEVEAEVCFVKLASYDGDKRGDEVRELIGIHQELRGRDVVLVEDIIDTGNTLKKMIENLHAHQPASIAVYTLLLKPETLVYDFEELAYIGFEIDKDFVVGYGLDYKGLGRNLKAIYKAV